MGWDAQAYDERFGFVSGYGRGLVELLGPRSGEAVLDLGSGTGQLAAEIAASGASVQGLDRDEQMVLRARARYPDLTFRLGDARTFTVPGPVDAVFSNATLHWVPVGDQPTVLDRVRAALRPGGRFVAEMGGAENVAALLAAADRALVELGLEPVPHPWCFPSPAEQAARLQSAGFDVRLLKHFARPTRLADGDSAADLFRMFGQWLLEATPPDRHDELLAAVDRHAGPALRDADGRWTADYVRLRWWAVAR